MSEAEFNQEYMADFNVFEGQVWAFNHETQVNDLSEIETGRMDVFAGMDVGYKDPTAFCVIAYDWDAQKYYLLDEYLDAERTTEQHAVQIQKLIHKWDIDYIYIEMCHIARFECVKIILYINVWIYPNGPPMHSQCEDIQITFHK